MHFLLSVLHSSGMRDDPAEAARDVYHLIEEGRDNWGEHSLPRFFSGTSIILEDLAHARISDAVALNGGALRREDVRAARTTISDLLEDHELRDAQKLFERFFPDGVPPEPSGREPAAITEEMERAHRRKFIRRYRRLADTRDAEVAR